MRFIVNVKVGAQWLHKLVNGSEREALTEMWGGGVQVQGLKISIISSFASTVIKMLAVAAR